MIFNRKISKQSNIVFDNMSVYVFE